MSQPNTKLVPTITIKDSGLIKAGNSVKITNKILEEHSKRQLIPKIKSVIIGTQEWMVENLNVDCFRNGDPIPEAKTNEEWTEADSNKKPAWCYFDNDPMNGEKYGKLYNWHAVKDPRGLAPDGWHVSTNIDKETLELYLGEWEVAGGKMKSLMGWKNGKNGNNESGFSGLPGGCRNRSGFYHLGIETIWWTSDFTSYQLDETNMLYSQKEYYSINGFYVRCLKDSIMTTNKNSNIDFKTIIIGKQEWMEENLSIEHFRNGDIIIEADTAEKWEYAYKYDIPAWCYYNNDNQNRIKYGKLYNWYAVNDIRGLAPKGWHIPYIEEWQILLEYFEKEYSDKPEVFKSKSGWGRYNWTDNCPDEEPYLDDGNGTNISGFNAIPGGYRNCNGAFSPSLDIAEFWSRTDKFDLSALTFVLYTNNIFHSLEPYPFLSEKYKGFGLSVRCIKNSDSYVFNGRKIIDLDMLNKITNANRSDI